MVHTQYVGPRIMIAKVVFTDIYECRFGFMTPSHWQRYAGLQANIASIEFVKVGVDALIL